MIKILVLPFAEDEYPIRLADGTSGTEGRVEIFFNVQWGSVCGWDWTSFQAGVVCRQLGLSGQSIPVLGNYEGETGTFHMKDVNCNGHEARLTDCSFKGWGYGSLHCISVTVAGVICLTGNCKKKILCVFQSTYKGNLICIL